MLCMFLENLGFDSVDPQRLGTFWEAALGSERITDGADIVETRVQFDDTFYLDLCFPQVPARRTEPLRFHLDLHGGDRQQETVDRLVALGARPLDIGQGDVPWVVLSDPEGNPFCVLEERDVHVDTGPIAALPLDSADPQRDGEFWQWLAGWTPAPGVAPVTLRHPSRHGPLLEFRPEAEPKGAAKNRLHLDVRLERNDDPEEVARTIADHGGREFEHDWGELPWRVYLDPSGNEFCVLPAPA